MLSKNDSPCGKKKSATNKNNFVLYANKITLFLLDILLCLLVVWTATTVKSLGSPFNKQYQPKTIQTTMKPTTIVMKNKKCITLLKETTIEKIKQKQQKTKAKMQTIKS